MPFREYTFSDMQQAIEKQDKEYDIELLKKAYSYAQDAHEGQFRKSGERFFNHPVACSIILIDLGMDSQTVAAALLHDVVEDTDVEVEDIKKEFGADIATLVDAVTKLRKIPYAAQEDQQAENIRKMLLAMAEDIRVIIIKLADRLHNMRTLSAMPDYKRREKSKETLEIFAPIAHRLGIRTIKEELEDLAIQHLDPIAYGEVEQSLNSRRQYREEFLQSIISSIEDRLGSAVENIHLEGRVKSIHGIYRKMYLQGKTFEEIFDVYAVRIITDTVVNCYNILGFIHDMFRPIPGRFKDYISTPKPNMYQSLHTTLLSRDRIPFEVQIRTWDMHHTAEYGIAAHWKYKEGVTKQDKNMEQRLAWVRHLLENQQESEDVKEIVTTIKSDLVPEDVFALTPKGDVISLPQGSCVIDFAYAIHTQIGHRMIGAKVDSRMVPFDHIIKTGEVIEVLTTSQSRGPSRDWLNMVKTSEARNKIRSWFKKERRAENIEQGRDELEKEFKRNYISVTGEEFDKLIKKLAERSHYETADDFFAAIGYGGVQISNLMPRIKEEQKAKKAKEKQLEDIVAPPKTTRANRDGIVVDDMDNCLTHLAHCCNPLPGDMVIGFITRGHGVSVHKRDCTNVPKDLTTCDEPERWVRVHWTEKQSTTFQSTLAIHAISRAGLLADITAIIAEMRLMIYAVNAREMKGGNSEIVLTLSIENVEHLKNIINKLSKVDGVFSVERTGV